MARIQLKTWTEGKRRETVVLSSTSDCVGKNVGMNPNDGLNRPYSLLILQMYNSPQLHQIRPKGTVDITGTLQPVQLGAFFRVVLHHDTARRA